MRKSILKTPAGPSYTRWALLLVALVLAAALRLYRLGEWPPGPYRDEAFNGLDAMNVLRGDHALFFPANNGREPGYIYLVALSVALFGPTTFALRLPAALIGALATVPVYLLGQTWFGRVTGALSAILWATTFWPVHLGRIGLRAGLLAPMLALTFWLGTLAFSRRSATLWFVAGIAYGFTFYTYLGVRFTPLLLACFAIYLVATGRRERLWAGGRVLWFVAGSGLAIAPLAITLAADPSLIIGRAGQVSILNPDVSDGSPARALLQNTGRAFGMFLWRGDDILRHNALLDRTVLAGDPAKAGRPVFDLMMAVPFIAGLAWCVRHWRLPAAAFLLLWQVIMLFPTILAEDAPHFLRASGVLPGTVFLPAIGLSLLWNWVRAPQWARRTAVLVLLAGSAVLTATDYARYARQPDVGYLFESAAAELARSIKSDSESAVLVDRRFPEGWPSIPFLLGDHPATPFDPASGLPPMSGGRFVVYAWPYDSLDFLAGVAPPALVEVTPGPAARGDLESEAYSLYTRYAVTPGRASAAAVDVPAGNFADRFLLTKADARPAPVDALEVVLQWGTGDAFTADGGRLPSVFIHVNGPEGTIGQYDGPISGGLWPGNLWQTGLTIGESHTIPLSRPFDPARDLVQVGLYWPETGQRLPLVGSTGQPPDDRLIILPEAVPAGSESE
ncbi:MAG TPA: glycosyltransferase family 39 protein [Promineifilum sp.]